MEKHGRPNQIKVDYVQTGTDTAETQVTFKTDHGKSITVGDHEFGTSKFDTNHDVFVHIDFAHVADWSDDGRKQLSEWNTFNKAEARDLAEYKRLKKKFESLDTGD
jgi:hypothetical protein